MPGGGSKPGERRGGRQKGVPNQLTTDVKAMILAALDAAGGADYLLTQAHANPSAFMVLVGKVLPLQLSGANGGPVEMIVTGVRRAMEIEEEVGEQLAIEMIITGVRNGEDADADTE